ncbi:MAG: MBL fold metallo-hydrolase [Nitrospinae bacterium]|nr:MBL fold metallo-hydrolase [Nitrospinota bacterium]MBI3815795.1 MBL fold metallo-hydrolase [Nitrospinota bacterium]
MIFETIVVGALDVNCYIVGCESHGSAAVIDPGDNSKTILDFIKSKGFKITYIINTHAHADHVGANGKIKESSDAPLLIHKGDSDFLTSEANREMAAFYGVSPSPKADRLLSDGDIIEICPDVSFRVIHTPGHSPGGICLLYNGFLFTGDTLFAGSVGRSDLPGGSHSDLISSIKTRLMVLDDKVKVFPGHGPSSTIGEEKEYNPFVRG